MADVIATVADGIATGLECFKADLIAFVAVGIATGSFYFSLNSVLLNKTSSHM